MGKNRIHTHIYNNKGRENGRSKHPDLQIKGQMQKEQQENKGEAKSWRQN